MLAMRYGGHDERLGGWLDKIGLVGESEDWREWARNARVERRWPCEVLAKPLWRPDGPLTLARVTSAASAG